MKKPFVGLVLFAFLFAASLATGQSENANWLTVEVTGESGQPLRNVCVTFVPKVGEILFRKADKRGHVKLKRPPAGDYRVVVKVDGYEAQKREVSVGAKSETVAFALKPSGTR